MAIEPRDSSIINRKWWADMLDAWEDYSARNPGIKPTSTRNPIFVHFSKGIEISKGRKELKVGVRPIGKGHSDPPGVFGYPMYWIIEDAKFSSKYATDFGFYAVFELDRLNSEGVVLSDVPDSTLDAVARANGWMSYWNSYVDSDTYWNSYQQDGYMRGGIPGLWYQTANRAVVEGLPTGRNLAPETKPISWAKLLRGVDWIEDTGQGVIYKAEPAQVCVLNMQAADVISAGPNVKIKTYKPHPIELKHIKNIARKYGFKHSNLNAAMVHIFTRVALDLPRVNVNVAFSERLDISNAQRLFKLGKEVAGIAERIHNSTGVTEIVVADGPIFRPSDAIKLTKYTMRIAADHLTKPIEEEIRDKGVVL